MVYLISEGIASPTTTRAPGGDVKKKWEIRHAARVSGGSTQTVSTGSNRGSVIVSDESGNIKSVYDNSGQEIKTTQPQQQIQTKIQNVSINTNQQIKTLQPQQQITKEINYDLEYNKIYGSSKYQNLKWYEKAAMSFVPAWTRGFSIIWAGGERLTNIVSGGKWGTTQSEFQSKIRKNIIKSFEEDPYKFTGEYSTKTITTPTETTTITEPIMVKRNILSRTITGQVGRLAVSLGSGVFSGVITKGVVTETSLLLPKIAEKIATFTIIHPTLTETAAYGVGIASLGYAGYKTYEGGEAIKSAGGTSEEIGGFYLQNIVGAGLFMKGFSYGYKSVLSPKDIPTIQKSKVDYFSVEKGKINDIMVFDTKAQAKVTSYKNLNIFGRNFKTELKTDIVDINAETRIKPLSSKYSKSLTLFETKSGETYSFGTSQGFSKRIGKGLYLTNEKGVLVFGEKPSVMPKTLEGIKFESRGISQMLKGSIPGENYEWRRFIDLGESRGINYQTKKVSQLSVSGGKGIVGFLKETTGTTNLFFKTGTITKSLIETPSTSPPITELQLNKIAKISIPKTSELSLTKSPAVTTTFKPSIQVQKQISIQKQVIPQIQVQKQTQKLKPRISEVILAGTNTRIIQKVTPTIKTIQSTRTIITPITTTFPIQKQIITPITTTFPIQKQIITPITTTFPIQKQIITPKIKTLQATTPFTPPPIFPVLPKIVGAGRFPSSRKVKGKRKYKYTPSYEAFVFKIKGLMPKGVESGLRIRPITKGFRW